MEYELDPDDFNPKFHASACIILNENKFIMLRRPKNSIWRSKWALPVGKAEKNETPDETLKREVSRKLESRLLFLKNL